VPPHVGGTREKWGHIKKISAGASRRHSASHLQIASDATVKESTFHGSHAKLHELVASIQKNGLPPRICVSTHTL